MPHADMQHEQVQHGQAGASMAGSRRRQDAPIFPRCVRDSRMSRRTGFHMPPPGHRLTAQTRC
eukprot:266788-Chlamydomonas_euryale.AAC.1